MVTCDKGVMLEVQAFWVRRTCPRASLGCRVYNGSTATKEAPDGQIRGDLAEITQHFRKITDWLEATLHPCYHSFSYYHQVCTSPKPTYALSRCICPRTLKSIGHAINTLQDCLSNPFQVHCYQNWENRHIFGYVTQFYTPFQKETMFIITALLFKGIFSPSVSPGSWTTYSIKKSI